MKRHYFKFQDWLVPKVETGTKRCTIRAERKRLAKVGDVAVLECWSGRPYRSKPRRIGESSLINVKPIRVNAWEGRKEGIQIIFDGVELIGAEARQLAIDDGFESLQHFADFFRPRLPFTGHFYEWQPIQP